MSRPVVVVSAHLDDAVFSATSQLLRSGARIVTVFAGAPPQGSPPGAWDRLTGALDPVARVRERGREDDAAIALCGATGSRLEVLDEQHRSPGAPPPDPAVLARALAGSVAGAGEVWLAAAVGGHPDHVATRLAGTHAVEAAPGPRPDVHLYADVPYAVHYGWPPSVTGAPAASPYLDLDQWLAQELLVGGLDPDTLPHRTVHALDEGTRRRKVALMSCYRTQLPALDPGGRLAAGDPLLVGFEVSWGPL